MNAHLEDDLFDDPEHDADRAVTSRSQRRKREQRQRRSKGRGGRSCLALLLSIAVLGAAAFFAFGSLRSLVPSFGGSETEDYPGPGSGDVEVTVSSGQSGSDIGTALEEADVVKSSGAFVQAATAAPDKAAQIQPGIYQLKKQMKASDALDWLSDSGNRHALAVTIPEGLWQKEIYKRLSEFSEIPVAEYEAAAKSKSLKLPPEARGKVEGWLFPSTYEFDKDSTALQQLNTMVEKQQAELKEAGVPRDKWQRTLTVASIVEGEAGAADRGKVARVIENRLKDKSGPTVGMLNMDSTVHYIYQERGKAGTTDAMRADPSPYNTYKHVGLPPGPINNPGAAAVEAAGNPDPGPWLFFVTVDPDTGKTKFATTQRGHDNNVKEFQQWCRTHKDRC